MATSVRSKAKRQGRWIDVMWRTALVLVLVTQLFMLSLRTPAGARIIPAKLVKMGFMRQRQVGFLLKAFRPESSDVVPALVHQIQQTIPRDCRLHIVWSGAPLPVETSQMAYQLYPRQFTQRTGVTGDHPEELCRVDWISESDVTLTSPAAVWQYQSTGATPR